MSLLFESIRCYEGNLLNLEYHERRLNRSQQEVLNIRDLITLKGIVVPKEARTGLWKCRVSYSKKIDKVEFSKYSPAKSKIFKLISADIQYAHKFEDRSELNKLFIQKGSADDIIIIGNGQITDASYGNLIFKRGEKWLTPLQPLLPGTMRALLLENRKIAAERITPNDLSGFSAFMMINALNPFNEERTLPITNIV